MKHTAEHSGVWAEQGRGQAQPCVHELACPNKGVKYAHHWKNTGKHNVQSSLPTTSTSLCDALALFNLIIQRCNNIYRPEKMDKHNSSPLNIPSANENLQKSKIDSKAPCVFLCSLMSLTGFALHFRSVALMSCIQIMMALYSLRGPYIWRLFFTTVSQCIKCSELKI